MYETDHVTARFLLTGPFSPHAGPFSPHPLKCLKFETTYSFQTNICVIMLAVSCHISMIHLRVIYVLANFCIAFAVPFSPHRPYYRTHDYMTMSMTRITLVHGNLVCKLTGI